ncbi:hypothetical protein H096_24661 [Pseudomonas sp. FH1]|jgi:hypothetical protein|nr:hypothetical protein H096_24661 [Pseudomonas sp. FH1]
MGDWDTSSRTELLLGSPLTLLVLLIAEIQLPGAYFYSSGKPHWVMLTSPERDAVATLTNKAYGPLVDIAPRMKAVVTDGLPSAVNRVLSFRGKLAIDRRMVEGVSFIVPVWSLNVAQRI